MYIYIYIYMHYILQAIAFVLPQALSTVHSSRKRMKHWITKLSTDQKDTGKIWYNLPDKKMLRREFPF